jgi:hypothetical protein
MRWVHIAFAIDADVLMVVSVGIDGVGTTPTRARLNVLADVSPQCRNRDTEMQRICCTPLCVRKVDIDR